MDHMPYLQSAILMREWIRDPYSYPHTIPLIKKLTSIKFHPKVTFIVGENGSGKSTLLEALAVRWGFNAEGGTKNLGFATRDTHSDLHYALKLNKSYLQPMDGFFLRAESFYNVASEIDRLDEDPEAGTLLRDYYGGKSLHEQSHGESFFSLMMHRFFGQGLYILDEPEAALSPMRQMAMLSRMHQLVTEESQFIIATHSPILMAYPDAQILSIEDDELVEVDYEDTEHFQETKRFINNHQRMLSLLLGD